MDRTLYETIRALVDLAETGIETIKASADGPAERRTVAEAEQTLVMGRYYVEEYDEQYRHGLLPE